MPSIIRGSTHVTDTLAFRAMVRDFPGDWIERSHTDRDYGIDFQLEFFKARNPTGRVAMVQLKGTEAKFSNGVQLSNFPTKTIEYAQLFDVPFFLFHTSIASGETFFVWLQKYAETKLAIDAPRWKSQDSVTIYFPEENTLKINRAKIESITKRHHLKSVALDFLYYYEWLEIHKGNIFGGEFNVAYTARDLVSAISKIDSDFWDVYASPNLELDFNPLIAAFSCIAENESVDQSNREVIEEYLEGMRFTKLLFLDERDMDMIAVEIASTDAYPY